MMGAFFVGLFSSLAGFFAQYLTKKLSIGLAAITAFVALTAAFYGAIFALLSGLYVALPATAVQYMSYCIPSNFPACLSAVIAGEFVAAAYNHTFKKMQLLLL